MLRMKKKYDFYSWIIIIIKYVVFVQGYIPKRSLLIKYNLKEFVELVAAVKLGDIRLLNDTFVKYERFFIGAGIYLLLEKLKFVAYRNLFKKM